MVALISFRAVCKQKQSSIHTFLAAGKSNHQRYLFQGNSPPPPKKKHMP